MILRSHTAWLVPAALTLLSFGAGNAKAIAQTTYNFSITYDTEFFTPPLDESLQPEVVNISQLIQELPPRFQATLPENLPSELTNPALIDVEVIGVSNSPETPFGLTSFSSNTVGLPLPPQIDPETGAPTRQVSIFRADPAAFGVDLPTPEFSDVYFGDETGNRLIGLANDQAIFDFVEGTVAGEGIITIVGGAGIFEGATGQIRFTQQDELGPPGASIIGEAKLDFSVEVPQQVPESSTNATLVGMGVIGSLYLLRRRRQGLI